MSVLATWLNRTDDGSGVTMFSVVGVVVRGVCAGISDGGGLRRDIAGGVR